MFTHTPRVPLLGEKRILIEHLDTIAVTIDAISACLSSDDYCMFLSSLQSFSCTTNKLGPSPHHNRVEKSYRN